MIDTSKRGKMRAVENIKKYTIENKWTFVISFVVILIIHLFFATSGMLNNDNLTQMYNNQDMSVSGRFTLTYLAGISSYFDLHYLNTLLSIIYIALTIVILVDLFNVKNKFTIFLIALIYGSFPSVGGTLTYTFTADAYFLANLLIVISVYIIYKRKFNLYLSILSLFLIYVSIATYQSNLAYIGTLILVLFLRDILKQELNIKKYINLAIISIFGLLIYIVRFKIYEYNNTFTNYQGIDKAGEMSLKSIIEAIKNVYIQFIKDVFNPLETLGLYEILNWVYLVLIIALTFFIVLKSKRYFSLLIICISYVVLPIFVYCIFFISQDVMYHILMIQHLAFMYIFGLLVFEDFKMYFNKNLLSDMVKNLLFLVIVLISYNFIIITNIYYEKQEQVNNQTATSISHISYDIRKIANYSSEKPIYIIGNFNDTLNLNGIYDLKTPFLNPGVWSIIEHNVEFIAYLNNITGLKNTEFMPEESFISKNRNEFEQLNIWPSSGSVKEIDGVIVIKFSEEVEN